MKVFKYLNFDKLKTLLILFLLTITLGGFIRFYKISQIPAGYYFNEIAVGVNSYFLANSLKDEFGNTIPDFIKIADDYRHGAIFYATAPFIRLLGLNIFSVRLSTAFFGLLIVISTFFLSLIITNQKKIALLSSMFVAISPWFTNMSRSSNEVILALFFLILSATSFLLAQQGKKIEPYSTIAHYFLMFYSKDYRDNFEFNPNVKEEYLKNRKLEGDWQLGKYYFRHDKCKEITQIETDILYSVGQDCPIPTWARIIGQSRTTDRIPMITFFDAPYSKEQLAELKLKDKLLEEKVK